LVIFYIGSCIYAQAGQNCGPPIYDSYPAGTTGTLARNVAVLYVVGSLTYPPFLVLSVALPSLFWRVGCRGRGEDPE
jgi:hypothetical protein